MTNNTSITFSLATRNDLHAITDLFSTTIVHVNKNHYSPQEIKAWAKGADNIDNWYNRIDNHFFLLAKIDDTLVGMASLDIHGYLDVIYVHKDHQGKKIASTLLKKMETKAREDGHEQITSDVSITAKPFFLHFGYTVIQPQLVLCRGVVLRNYHVSKALNK